MDGPLTSRRRRRARATCGHRPPPPAMSTLAVGHWLSSAHNLNRVPPSPSVAAPLPIRVHKISSPLRGHFCVAVSDLC